MAAVPGGYHCPSCASKLADLYKFLDRLVVLVYNDGTSIQHRRPAMAIFQYPRLQRSASKTSACDLDRTRLSLFDSGELAS